MKRRRFLASGTAALAAGFVIHTPGPIAAAHPAVRPATEPDPGVGPTITTRADAWAVVPQLTASPDSDGRIPASAWTDAPELTNFERAYTRAPLDNSPVYRLGWVDGVLAVHGEIPADLADQVARILILVDPDASDDTFFAIDITIQDGRLTSTLDTSHDWQLGSGWSQERIDVTAHHERDADDNLIVDATWQLADMGVSGTPSGEWRCNIVQVCEMGEGPLTSWVGIHRSQYTERSVSELDGPVTFSSSLAAEGAWGTLTFDTSSTLVTPATHALTWQGFAHKNLTITTTAPDQRRRPNVPDRTGVHLTWIAPDATSTVVADQTLDSPDIDVTFTHPAPTIDGVYQLRAAITNPGRDDVTMIISIHHAAIVAAGLAAVGEVFPVPPTVTLTPAPISSEAQALLDLLPDQYGLSHVGHPEFPEIRPQSGNWELSADRLSLTYLPVGSTTPEHMTFPNEAYPETHAATARNALGQIVEYPYYEDNGGRRYFFTAALWGKQRAYVRDQLPDLAVENPLDAARLLHAFATRAAGYVLRTNNEWNTYLTSVDSGPPYNSWSGYFSVWTAQELNHLESFLLAYAEVAKTDAFDLVASETGDDVSDMFWRHLVFPSLTFVLSVNRTMHNTDPYLWRRITDISRTLHRPDLIHMVIQWMDDFMQSQFLADGFWKEITPDYHSQVVNNVASGGANLNGYSDPADYVSPRTGETITNFDGTHRYPLLPRQQALTNILTYPNRRAVPIQDTWAVTRRSANPEPGSLVLPAAKVSRLSDDVDAPAQLYVLAEPKYGHNHLDPLSISMFANDQELLTDIGYTYTKYRMFTASTIGHNTVLVDASDMDLNSDSKHGGDIVQFIPGDGIQVVAARYPTAYPQTSEYARQVVSIHTTNGPVYLDLFRVRGGERHEYTLNGAANDDAEFVPAHDTTPYGDYLLPPGVEVRPPVDFQDFGSAEGHYPGYQYVRDVATVSARADRYDLEMVTRNEAGDELGKCTITGLLEDEPGTVFIGRSPSLRATRLHGSGVNYDNNEQADLYSLPKLVHRREGEDLASAFATVIEPFTGRVGTVELSQRVPITSGPATAIAVRIIHGDTDDLVISNPDGGTVTLDDTTLTGEFARIRIVDGALRRIDLAGEALTHRGTTLTGTAPVDGPVHHTRASNAGTPGLACDIAVPAGWTGGPVRVTHPDGTSTILTVTGTASDPAGVFLELTDTDPGFVVNADGSSHEPNYPGRTWPTGEHTVTITTLASQDYTDPAPSIDTGTVTGTILDTDGAPIADANVWITGFPSITTTTTTDGTFELTGVPVGERHVTADHDEYYRHAEGPAEVTAGTTTTVDATLRARPQQPEAATTDSYQIPGGLVHATPSVDGTICLVNAEVPRNADDIRDAVGVGSGGTVLGVSGAAIAETELSLDTTGMEVGRYSLYLIDVNDAVSPAVPVTLVPSGDRNIDSEDPLVTYLGSWTRYNGPKYWEGSFRYGQTNGDSVSIGFHGTRATIHGNTNASGGLADVHLDGQFVTTIDYYGGSAQQVLMFDTGDLSRGVHVVTLIARDERGAGHPSSNYAQVRFDVAHVTG